MLPIQLYRLLSQQPGIPPLEIFRRQIQVTQTGATISGTIFSLDIPGRLLLLTAMSIRTVPSGGELLAEAFVYMASPATDAASITLPLAGSRDAGAANNAQSFHWSGFVFVPNKWRLGGQASFSAAVQSKTATVQAFGVLIPEGNFLT